MGTDGTDLVDSDEWKRRQALLVASWAGRPPGDWADLPGWERRFDSERPTPPGAGYVLRKQGRRRYLILRDGSCAGTKSGWPVPVTRFEGSRWAAARYRNKLAREQYRVERALANWARPTALCRLGWHRDGPTGVYFRFERGTLGERLVFSAAVEPLGYMSRPIYAVGQSAKPWRCSRCEQAIGPHPEPES